MGKREPVFDNYKAILIFGVIIMHLIRYSIDKSPIVNNVYNIVNVWLMPAFVFLSGFFSRNTDSSREKAFRGFLIPYFLFSTLFSVLEFFVKSQEGTMIDFKEIFTPATPRWGFWFLISAFTWKLISKDLLNLRFNGLITLVIGVTIPIIGDFEDIFSLGRTISFLFFFTMGLAISDEFMEKIKEIHPLVALVVVSLALYFIILFSDAGYLTRDLAYGKRPMDIGEGFLIQAGRRMMFYFFAFYTSLMFIPLVPKRKGYLTYIGKNSVIIYIGHIFTVYYLRKTGFLGQDGLYILLYSVLISAGLCIVFSLPPVVFLYHKLVRGVNLLLFKDMDDM